MSIDPERLVFFPGVTKEDVEYLQQDFEATVVSAAERVERSLKHALSLGFSDVAVIGLYPNGEISFSSSVGDPERMLGLMQRGVVELGQDLRDCATSLEDEDTLP